LLPFEDVEEDEDEEIEATPPIDLIKLAGTSHLS
jgi:hypothetical protein